jgi:RND family efflux transporter MFP subunit
MALVLLVAFLIVHHVKAVEQSDLAARTAEAAQSLEAVDVIAVKAAPAALPLVLPGDTRGWHESTIYARVSGYVDKWFVDIGDRVKKGQVLADIDTPDLDAQLSAAGHELAVSQSQVGVAQANQEFARTTYDRWRQAAPGDVSVQETQEKKAQFDSSTANLKATQSKVSADQADVTRLEAMKAFAKVTAPYDGVITARQIDIGDLVTAGSTASTTLLYRMAQADPIRVFVDVPQNASADMNVGVPATAVANDYSGRTFRGQIARTSAAIDPISKTLHVEVDIPNPKLILLPGMYMEVTFQLPHSAMVEVPASALIFRSGGPQLAVVDSDGTVHFSNITIAQDQGDVVEVGSGVSIGQKVALNISSQVSDGEKVEIHDTGGAAPPAQTQAPSTQPLE